MNTATSTSFRQIDYELPGATVHVRGQQGDPESRMLEALQFAKEHQATTLTIFQPPISETDAGWYRVVEADSGIIHSVEGVVLKHHRQAGLFQTRDCWTVVVYNRVNFLVGVGHVGRRSLKNEGCGSASTIHALLAAVQPAKGEHISAYLVGGICAEHYPTDIPAAIRNILQDWGVQDITVNDYCSFEDKGLGSKRADAAGISGNELANWALVVKR